MNTRDTSHLAGLSPFELKDEWIKLARSVTSRLMLNAGRGDPNSLATIPHHGFWQLRLIAMVASERSFSCRAEGVGAEYLERYRQQNGGAATTS